MDKRQIRIPGSSMSVVGYKARNHPQQVSAHGPRKDVDERTIPADDFAPLDKRFQFTIDAAATAENTRLPRYWTEADNALEQSWTGERVWCNPPYSHPNLSLWVQKAWYEWRRGASLIVMLVPANRTEQEWWQRWVEPDRDRTFSFRAGHMRFSLRAEFLPGRMRFLAPGATEIGPNERPPFGCCLLIWQT
jgi:phage N-6-adenine-methyltransferase